MLTLQRTGEAAGISLSIAEQDFENLLAREWLLTNGRGGYASSTVTGCNTRGYHGLLIGSLKPPVSRIMALSACLEIVQSGQETFTLSSFEFADKLTPASAGALRRFRRDIGAHFDYELEKIDLTKSVYLVRDVDMVAVVYDFTRVQEPAEFTTRPFVGLRDFHSLQKSAAPLCASRWHGLPAHGTHGQACPEHNRRDGPATTGVVVHQDTPDGCCLLLRCPSASFEEDPQWWFNFAYRAERERGLGFTEDLWTPGFFKCRIDTPMKIVLWAGLYSDKSGKESDNLTHFDLDAVCEDLREHQESLPRVAGIPSAPLGTGLPAIRSGGSLKAEVAQAIPGGSFGDGPETCRMGNSLPMLHNGTRGTAWAGNLPILPHYYDSLEILCLAADQFVTKRQVNHRCETTILAGYPWFADWGRDAFIALPGLLLATGRFSEARSVLTTFAAAADDGLIPNRFDDNGGSPHFNSVDASLWFINAAFQYLQATGDSKTFQQELLPTIRWIIDSYCKGTRFGIHADADGLITAGDEQTQLTWMDAKYDGVAFTPRYGKAVEVNALWYNALMLMKDSQISNPDSQCYSSMATKVKASFRELFWNEDKGYLNDCILPNGLADDTLRPNQIFAVSLKFSPLSEQQQTAVVGAVQERLLTPYGLRTLSPDSPDYKGRYSGPPRQRDEAYHQGTVWPYLMGPFVEAYLKINEFSPQSRKQAAEFIQPLLRHLTEDGCIGSISEIFDGAPPHKPKGCIAQAWSVAELIRACQLINSP